MIIFWSNFAIKFFHLILIFILQNSMFITWKYKKIENNECCTYATLVARGLIPKVIIIVPVIGNRLIITMKKVKEI